MLYADHIKNKNAMGFVVNGNMPFLNLRDAEIYCADNDIPPNKDHLVYDPEKAQEIAFILHPELVRIQKRISSELEEMYEISMRKVREINKLKAERSGIGNVAEIMALEDQIKHLTGTHAALLNEYSHIFDRIEEMVCIIKNSFKEE